MTPAVNGSRSVHPTKPPFLQETELLQSGFFLGGSKKLFGWGIGVDVRTLLSTAKKGGRIMTDIASPSVGMTGLGYRRG